MLKRFLRRVSLSAVFGAGLSLALSDARAAEPLLMGADLSMLPEIESAGVKFKDAGQPRDALAIFAAHGINCVRLRLFVNPNGKAGVVNDLAYTMALAKRVKAAKLQWCLDIHYSDTWADPGHQQTPAAWQGQSLEQLQKTVQQYTADVIAQFRTADLLPDQVQIGNEITAGMLWPVGKFKKGETAANFDRLCALLKAASQGVRDGSAAGAKGGAKEGAVPKIIIHIDGGDHRGMPKWYFGEIIARDVPFDIIGVSFYPSKPDCLTNLATNLNDCAAAFGKPVAVMETAYAWADSPWWAKQNLPWPATPDGQQQFLADVIRTVRAVPDGRGIGVFYWYPDSVPIKSERVDTYHGGDWALFDKDSNALAGLKAFEVKP